MKDLKDMTLEELRAQKKAWYDGNTKNGNIALLGAIARNLGSKLNHSYGPKYKYTEGNIEIYVDDYGGYMTVNVGGKLKVSTHNEKLYVPGGWEEIISRLAPDTKKQQEERMAADQIYEHQKLLNELS